MAVSIQRTVSVQFLRDSGAYTVKAIKGSRAPHRGWDPRTNSAAKSAQLLGDVEYSDDNIGAHFHDTIVDVDVDGENEQDYLVPALDSFLPTCNHIWGRRSRPKTHRAYLIRDTKNFDPRDHKILGAIQRIPEVKVEVRGGPVTRGEYSLLPGSVHPSGEEYQWADLNAARLSPTVTDVNTLLTGIRLAGACAVLAPLWLEGIRQDLCMSLAGFLHRAGAITNAIDADAFSISEEQALNFLTTLLNVSGDDESDFKMRVAAFQRTYKKANKGQQVYGATHIANVTGDKDVVNKLYTLLVDSPAIAELDEFCSRFAIWKGPALVIDLDGVKRAIPKPFITRPNFSSSYANRFIEIAGKRRSLPDLIWYLDSATRVEGLQFDPSQDETLIRKEDLHYVNTWSGFKVSPYEMEVTDEEVKPFLDYFVNCVCDNDPEKYEWGVSWCADIFKYPAEKCGTALVLVGQEGAGKTILGEQVIGKIIGDRHYAVSSSIENVTRNFNAAYGEKLLIQCDEALNARQRWQAARLKALITDAHQMVEPKGVDPYKVALHARMLFTSNDVEDAMYLSATDRRYTVFKVSNRRVADTSYWKNFVGWLKKDDNLSKLHRWFIDLDYDRTKLHRPLDSAERRMMQQASWDAVDEWLAIMVARDHPISEDSHKKPWYAFATRKRPKLIDRQWPDYVYSSALLADFEQHQRKHVSNYLRRTLNEGTLLRMLGERGVMMAGNKLKANIKEYDHQKGVEVQRRVRLNPAPVRGLICKYLHTKYGWEEAGGGDEDNEEPPTEPQVDVTLGDNF